MTTKVRLIGIKTERWQKRSLLLPRGRGYAPSMWKPQACQSFPIEREPLARLAWKKFLQYESFM
jgi:hypothetical protein